MTALIIVGGFYRELCHEPPVHDELLGSGGRAGRTVRCLGIDATLATCVDAVTQSDASDWSTSHGIALQPTPVDVVPSFQYRHPLSVPVVRPPASEFPNPAVFQVGGPVVLRFGMLEANPVVDASVAIYDPQSAFGPESFWANGSTAQRLAVVANEFEARAITGSQGSTYRELANDLRRAERAEVAVVKAGPFGCWVAEHGDIEHVPARITPTVWSLGSGDVFSAVFTVRWGLEGVSAVQAATEASRAVAAYADTRVLPSRDTIRNESPYAPLHATPTRSRGHVYLASPFFTTAQRWLVDEIRAALPNYVRVFSPFHDIGRGPPETVAPADLRAIESSVAVIAVVDGHDPGTLFEVGYARSRNVPVVVLAEAATDEALVMLTGSGCVIANDLCSAVYHVVWQVLNAPSPS